MHRSAISGAFAVLQKAKGAEKNLLLKKYVKDIKCSKKKIEMTFYYQPIKNSANNKDFETSSQSATAALNKSKPRSKGGGVSKPANREPASDGLLRPAPAAAVRNLNLCGENVLGANSGVNCFVISFPNTITKWSKVK